MWETSDNLIIHFFQEQNHRHGVISNENTKNSIFKGCTQTLKKKKMTFAGYFKNFCMLILAFKGNSA